MNDYNVEIRKLLKINTRAAAGDKLLVVTDNGPFCQPVAGVRNRKVLAQRFCSVAKSMGLDARSVFYTAPNRPGCEPPLHVWRECFPDGFAEYFTSTLSSTILVKAPLRHSRELAVRAWLKGLKWPGDIVVVLSKYSITHTRFADFLSRLGGCRVATMPGLEPGMFFGVLRADWKRIKKRSEKVAGRLSSANSAIIVSAGQNVLEMSLVGREGIPDTGIIASGEVGNLPGGEAFIAPVEGTAHGRIAIGPRQAPAKWILVFRKGRLQEIVGTPPFKKPIWDLIANKPRCAILAELGVGTNESATSTDSTLEAEKILGTIHVALGDNFSFGGRNQVDFHRDFICFNPTLLLRNEDNTEVRIVENGRFAL